MGTCYISDDCKLFDKERSLAFHGIYYKASRHRLWEMYLDLCCAVQTKQLKRQKQTCRIGLTIFQKASSTYVSGLRNYPIVLRNSRSILFCYIGSLSDCNLWTKQKVQIFARFSNSLIRLLRWMFNEQSKSEITRGNRAFTCRHIYENERKWCCCWDSKLSYGGQSIRWPVNFFIATI